MLTNPESAKSSYLRVVDTLETFSGLRVAVSLRRLLDVVGALARLALPVGDVRPAVEVLGAQVAPLVVTVAAVAVVAVADRLEEEKGDLERRKYFGEEKKFTFFDTSSRMQVSAYECSLALVPGQGHSRQA